MREFLGGHSGMERRNLIFARTEAYKHPPGSQTACTQNQRKGQKVERYIPTPQWETRV